MMGSREGMVILRDDQRIWRFLELGKRNSVVSLQFVLYIFFNWLFELFQIGLF